MPILVWYFATTSTTFVTWWWVNSWWCSSASRIAFATKASFVVPWTLTQKNKNKNYIPMLKCKQYLLKKKWVWKYTTHEWFWNHDTWILHPFIWFSCICWIPMSNPEHPMQLSKALHKQLYLPDLFQQGPHPFQSVPMHFVGWTPFPMPESQWCPTWFRKLKYQQRPFNMFHLLHLGLEFIQLFFLFHFIESLLFMLLLPCMWVAQNLIVHNMVILLPWSPNTSRRTAKFVYLHAKPVFVIQMLTK